MKKWLYVSACCLVTVSAFGVGEGTLKTDIAPASALSAALELRPSWKVGSQRVHAENSAEFSYQLRTDRIVGYIQYFDSNLVDFNHQDQGMGLIAQEGFFRLQMDNLWKNSTGLSFGYEPKLFLPTNAAQRDAGMVAEFRNHLKLNKEISRLVTLRMEEAPIFFAQTRAGAFNAKEGKDLANPIFQNRVYLVLDLNFTKELTFELPLRIQSMRYLVYASASNSGGWEHVVFIWPELDYAVNKNVTLGLSYYSDNFIKSDLSGITLGDGFNKGVAQLVLRASL